MSNKDTGGPAFPTDSAHQMIGSSIHHFEGMTLRDYFAAKTLQGFLASGQAGNKPILLAAVPVCYEIADAMLKARAS